MKPSFWYGGSIQFFTSLSLILFDPLFVLHLNFLNNVRTVMQLDDHIPLVCETGEISYVGLKDGNHTCEVCTKGSRGVGCATYTWIVG